jgi:hypothetical protein
MNKGEFLYLHLNNWILISPLNDENVICINVNIKIHPYSLL